MYYIKKRKGRIGPSNIGGCWLTQVGRFFWLFSNVHYKGDEFSGFRYVLHKK